MKLFLRSAYKSRKFWAVEQLFFAYRKSSENFLKFRTKPNYSKLFLGTTTHFLSICPIITLSVRTYVFIPNLSEILLYKTWVIKYKSPIYLRFRLEQINRTFIHLYFYTFSTFIKLSNSSNPRIYGTQSS